jgi:hypothetical protein
MGSLPECSLRHTYTTSTLAGHNVQVKWRTTMFGEGRLWLYQVSEMAENREQSKDHPLYAISLFWAGSVEIQILLFPTPYPTTSLSVLYLLHIFVRALSRHRDAVLIELSQLPRRARDIV